MNTNRIGQFAALLAAVALLAGCETVRNVTGQSPSPAPAPAAAAPAPGAKPVAVGDTVKVKADGKDIGQASAKLGVPAPIEVNLDGVLRLRVEITRQGGGCINEIGYGTNIGFADAKLTK